MRRFIFIFVLLAALIFSIPMAGSQPAIEVTARDTGNMGNGGDVEVDVPDFRPGDMLRIVVAKADSVMDIDTAAATEHYQLTDTMPTTLAADARDVDGELIGEGVAYMVYVLNVDDNILSEPSPLVTLSNEAVVRTVVSDLPAAAGGLTTDAEGNLYFADFGEPDISTGSTVYRITPDGEVSVFAETELLASATGNAFDASGNYYQSGYGSGRVVRVSPDGEITTLTDDGVFSGPVGIVIDMDGTFYITDCNRGSIQRISPDGVAERFVLSAFLRCPNGMTSDDAGNLYVANFRNSAIVRITPEAEVDVLTILPGTNNSHVLYHDGILYAVSRGENQIFTVTLDGEVTLFAGTGERGNDDGPALEATFMRPNAITISPDGRVLYINEVMASTENINYPSSVRAIVLPRSE